MSDKKEANQVENLVHNFLQYLKLEKNYSEKTLESYGHYLTRFLNWTNVKKVSSISPTLIRDYQVKLFDFKNEKGRKLKPKTRNYHLIALRSFLRYLITERGLEVMPPEKISLGKTGEREIDFLQSEELRKLFFAPNSKTKIGKRDRAILELLFSTGLRVSELVSLNRDKINLETREFSVVGKGGKSRVVFVSDRAARALSEYLETREDDLDPLFIRYRGPAPDEGEDEDEAYRLSARSVQRLVKKYVHKLGLTTEATPHTLRHTFATDLLRAGADVREVQELLGHKNVSTTQIYTHVTDQKLKEVHEEYHSGNEDGDSS
ncbi:MAG: site-specific tyrosine recombinase/integron integrase [Patescibacteria group bacterium]|nr:site-specific tyrosine recombinase/integron integrase [Patescibacteria group bacterium]